MNSHIRVDRARRVFVERAGKLAEEFGRRYVEIRVEHEDGSITDLTAASMFPIVIEVEGQEVPE